MDTCCKPAPVMEAPRPHLHTLHILWRVCEAQLLRSCGSGPKLLQAVNQARHVNDVVQAALGLNIFKVRCGLQASQGILLMVEWSR